MIISVVLTLWWIFSVLTSHLREVWLGAVLCLLCPAPSAATLALMGAVIVFQALAADVHPPALAVATLPQPPCNTNIKTATPILFSQL